MKVLITGGAGFIGSHTVRACLDAGHEVVAFDSFVTSSRAKIPEGVAVIEGDIRDPAALRAAMDEITHVIHLAALVSVPESVEKPEEYHEVNVTGFENVLEAAREANVERVAYASSAAVYGDEPSVPKREDSPLRPQSPYALSKMENEQQAARYSKDYGLPTVGLRFFNVYGPGQSADHPYASVIPRWVRRLEKGEPLLIYGDGSQTRDFVHVRDVAAALLASLGAGGGALVYNVATGTERSLEDLFSLFAAVSPVAPALERQPERSGDIRRSVADISLISSELTWEPKADFGESLRELLTP